MGSEEDLRKLGFQTRLKIFQEREKPREQQDLGALADWRAILEGLDRETGMHADLSIIQLLSTCVLHGSLYEVHAASNHGPFRDTVPLAHFEVLRSGMPLALSSYASTVSLS